MKTSVVLDYHLATGRVGYIVRALLKFEGDSVPTVERIPLNLSVVLDRSGSMSGLKLNYARRADMSEDATGILKDILSEMRNW